MVSSTPPITQINNPVLRGFNPDPSILRVGEDYFIATSTFEWFPGVQIHHSINLVNWELVTRPLDTVELLDLEGNPNSGGIWAPCLSYDEGSFYLIYTNVRSWDDGPYKVAHNYLTTAEDIRGPWSDPIYLNSSGFDPSLFHDDDGRKWLLNMVWDHRRGKNAFAGILLQEFCPETQRLVGPIENIFLGTELSLVEGPHLYKINGFYYLLTAEGGTQYEHAVTLARSRKINGPYEVHPNNPLLTSYGQTEAILQKAGHASMVETPEGEWYLAHLCGRPIDGKHCILGRETAIQKLVWCEDGWPELAQGGATPTVSVEAPAAALGNVNQPTHQKLQFNRPTLDIHFQSLRRPMDPSWISLTDRPGFLRLYGEEPTVSRFRQSLVARRLQAFGAEASTCLYFEPQTFQEMAGLIAYYDTDNHYYLRVSRDEAVGRCLNILQADAAEISEVLDDEISLPETGPITLKVKLAGDSLQFSFSTDGDTFLQIGPALPVKTLSDDYYKLGFTGAFLGLCAQDISGQRRPADFEFFTYQEWT